MNETTYFLVCFHPRQEGARMLLMNKQTGQFKMKLILSIVAVLLVIMGAVWVLQGLSLIGGSFMVGQTQWIAIGMLTMAVGAALLYYARKQGRS
jgi:cytochrome c biogenesis factor